MERLYYSPGEDGGKGMVFTWKRGWSGSGSHMEKREEMLRYSPREEAGKVIVLTWGTGRRNCRTHLEKREERLCAW